MNEAKLIALSVIVVAATILSLIWSIVLVHAISDDRWLKTEQLKTEQAGLKAAGELQAVRELIAALKEVSEGLRHSAVDVPGSP